VTGSDFVFFKDAKLTSVGVGLSQRLADDRNGSIHLAGSVAGAWLEELAGLPDRSAVRTSAALFWQNGGIASGRSWNLRAGVEVRPKSGLDREIGIAGFVRYLDHKSHFDLGVTGGKSTSGDEFISVRIGYFIGLGG
jgi:hypothetical protein